MRTKNRLFFKITFLVYCGLWFFFSSTDSKTWDNVYAAAAESGVLPSKKFMLTYALIKDELKKSVLSIISNVTNFILLNCVVISLASLDWILFGCRVDNFFINFLCIDVWSPIESFWGVLSIVISIPSSLCLVNAAYAFYIHLKVEAIGFEIMMKEMDLLDTGQILNAKNSVRASGVVSEADWCAYEDYIFLIQAEFRLIEKYLMYKRLSSFKVFTFYSFIFYLYIYIKYKYYYKLLDFCSILNFDWSNYDALSYSLFFEICLFAGFNLVFFIIYIINNKRGVIALEKLRFFENKIKKEIEVVEKLPRFQKKN